MVLETLQRPTELVSARRRLIRKIRSMGPLLFYTLQERVGATTPSYGSVATALTYNGPTLAQAGPIPGWVAPNFDNTNDFVAADVTVSPTTVSMMVVCKRTSTNDANHILFHVGQQTPGTGLAGLLINLSTGVNLDKPRMEVMVGINVSATIVAASAINATGWHIITGTYDLSNLNLYVDSVATTPVAETGALDWTTARIEATIGILAENGASVAFPYGGPIALCALFPRAISRSDHEACRRILGI